VSKTVEFRVLGPLEVLHDGVATRIGSPTQRTLLALLLMHPNEVVSTDRIVDVLWPDNPPDALRKLWFHVSKLRATLQPEGPEDPGDGMLGRQPTGYALRVDLDRVDAARFERLAHAARTVLEYEPAKAAELLRGAFTLWRGRPFADVVHEDAVSSEVARLGELRLTALEERFEADLALGRSSELVPELEVLVAEHPFREHLRAQLMLALYRAGRQADALAAYRQTRQTLVAELGIEPSQRLNELHTRILSHDPTLIDNRPAPSRPGTRREERKLVTVLLADLSDFTGSDAALDPEEIRAALTPAYTRIRDDLQRFGGTVEKLTGDSVVALFGVPAAHEDDPERAVRAALAIRDWLHERGRQLRMAVATGEAHVTTGARDREGEPVVVGGFLAAAARLQAAAPVGGVLVCEQTFHATRHTIEYREAEPVAATGKHVPTRAWEAIRVVVEPGVDLARHRSPFIDRQRELTALQERLAWAVDERSPQLVTILGAPGIGKTRLVAQLHHANTGAGEPVRWRQGRSLPYGDGVSFWALGEMIKAEAGILESDAAQQAGSKLQIAIRNVIEDPIAAGRIATFLGALIGLGDGEPATGDIRGETFASWRRFLEALAEERPLVLVFEDLHWADDALLDFVDELVDRVSGLPLLVIATARPELLERRPSWAGGKPGVLTISLSPLSRSDTTRLVAALLQRSTIAAETQHEGLLARIGGNPLYAEQLCRMLAEHGRLEQLPASLRSIIAARLDALPDLEKQLLQDAAVAGKVFWLGALETISGTSRRDAEALLQALIRREFVQRARHSSVARDVEYAFCHELLRDVAYEEVPRAARAERHRRAAEWIDSLGRPDDHAELLAHHYLAALQGGRATGIDASMLVKRTVQTLQRAGLRAMRLSTNERAVEHFSRAIALVVRLPEGDERTRTEGELHVQLGVALFALRGLGSPEVEQAYTRATELMLASASTADQFPAHFGLSIYHAHRGDFDRSMRLVDRLTELASEGDDSMKLQALHARWLNSLFGGRIDDAVAAADQARAIYRPQAHHQLSFLYGNHDPGVCALALQALAFALRGESLRAVTQMREAISLSANLGHAATLAQPLTQLPWALQINGDAEAALVESEQALTLEAEVVHPQFFGIAHAMRGWALARMGRSEEGVAELERALADERQSSDIWAAMIGALLAEAHLRQGRLTAARHILDDMLSLTQAMPSYVFEPELLRFEAEWLRATGREDDARGVLLRAISTAREHGSWALAVRCALTLARLPSAARESDLRLLGELCERLPPDNATDYAHEARTLLRQGNATTQP
jgi:DNA-binding SARP family transcriptional activator